MNTVMIEGNEVRVGDYVGFKCDIEQCGRVTQITQMASNVVLTLENPDGFEGEYIGGRTINTERAEDCWYLCW
jgi:hypothetical protein